MEQKTGSCGTEIGHRERLVPVPEDLDCGKDYKTKI